MKIMVARLLIRFYCSPSRLKLEYFHQVFEAMTLARVLSQKRTALLGSSTVQFLYKGVLREPRDIAGL